MYYEEEYIQQHVKELEALLYQFASSLTQATSPVFYVFENFWKQAIWVGLHDIVLSFKALMD